MVGLGRCGTGFRVVGLMILGSSLTSPVLAESFFLKSGEVIEGSVLNGTLNTLTIRASDGVKLTSLMQIERIVIEMADGSEITGQLMNWKDGVYEVRTDDDVLRIAGGELVEQEEPTTQTAEAAPVETTAESETETVATSSETIAMRNLPSFILKNGEVVIGRILHATGSILTIRPHGGSAVPLSRAQIESVTFESDEGEIISGKLLNWEDGVYRVQTDDERELLANLPDNAANAPTPLQTASREPADQPLDTPVATEIEQADAAALPAPDAETPAAEHRAASASDEVGVGGPANETAVAELTNGDAADQADAPVPSADEKQHRINAVVDPIDENSDSVVVQFQLSKPAERPLVVLYAATEATAKAGEDFEAKSGVVTFPTGSTYAEVQVPIINDDRGEDSEEFNLFLSGDPETITFTERQIAVTINDDD